MSLDTRQESYERTKPTTGRRRSRILELIRRSGIGLSCHEVAEILTVEDKKEVQDHSVSGRITELRRNGSIYEDGTVFNASTNRNVTKWRAK